jgi:hypothetical protein
LVEFGSHGLKEREGIICNSGVSLSFVKGIQIWLEVLLMEFWSRLNLISLYISERLALLIVILLLLL